jgi:hypothetical protein
MHKYQRNTIKSYLKISARKIKQNKNETQKTYI